MTKGKYLGLDFGDARVGVAISDVDKIIVFPRAAIHYHRPAELFEKLKQICSEESVTKIVIGLPIQMDGTVGEQVTRTYKFGQALRDAMPNVPVEYFDERLTTQFARERLREQGIKAKKQKHLKDSMAAQIILETYLKSRR